MKPDINTISEQILQPLHKIHYLTKSLLTGYHGMLNENQFEDLESIQTCVKDAIVETRVAFGLLQQEDFPTLFDVAHNLLTPSANIWGFSDLLLEGLDGHLTPEQCQTVEKIRLLGQQNRIQTYTVVDYARICSGYEAMLYQIPVYDLIPNHLDLLASEKNIALEYAIADDLPDVYSNRLYVGQTITNLVSNAVSATPMNGNIQIEIALSNSDEILVSIHDTGRGIDSAYIDSIFTPFWKLDLQSAGSGLGLFVSREFVRSQYGELWVESVPKQGTSASFTMKSFNSVR